jgi:hypothetical protein
MMQRDKKKKSFYVIWHSHSSAGEDSNLLECYTEPTSHQRRPGSSKLIVICNIPTQYHFTQWSQ